MSPRRKEVWGADEFHWSSISPLANDSREGRTNREIGAIVGISEQMIKNHLRRAFNKPGVWSRLELAMYVANHGGKDRFAKTQHRNSLSPLDRSTPTAA